MLPWDGGQGRHGEPQRRGGHHGEQGGEREPHDEQGGGQDGGQHGGHDHDASYEPYVDTSSCNTMAFPG